MESYGGSLGIGLALTISCVELQYMEENELYKRQTNLKRIRTCSFLYAYT